MPLVQTINSRQLLCALLAVPLCCGSLTAAESCADTGVDAWQNSPKYVNEHADASLWGGDSSVDAAENAAGQALTILQLATSKHQQIADYINNSGRSIDRFITQKILGHQGGDFSGSGARARLSWSNVYIQDKTYRAAVDVNIDLELQQSQRHLRLLIQSDNKRQNTHDSTTITTLPKDNEAREYTTGLQYLWSDYKNWRPSAKAALRWRQASIEPFATMSLLRVVKSQARNWQFEPQLAYYQQSFMHLEFSANYYQKLRGALSWRFDNGAHWQRHNNEFSYFHSPSIQLELSSKTSWQNQLLFAGDNKHTSVYNQLVLSSRLTSVVYRDWLVIELEPRLYVDLAAHSQQRQNYMLYLRSHVLFNR